MFLTDLAVRRPVFGSVISLLLITFGLVAYDRLPLREYPDIDPPIVTISTNYRGASAAIVESRITQIVEDRVSGIEGIRNISSTSSDGRSDVTLEFGIGRDIDAAANDVRDRISGILNNLPDEADPPEVQKAEGNSEVIMWLNLVSDRLDTLALTDYANRYLVDRFSVLDGVAAVRIGGGKEYAMRIWIDRQKLASRRLTVADVEQALRADNVELPAGSIESENRQFSIRTQRSFLVPEDFSRLVIGVGDDGYLIRLADVAQVELAAEEEKIMFRGNTQDMIGLGINRQSTANTLAVARSVNALVAQINPTLPEGMEIKESYDSSVFIQASIDEVYKTLFIALLLVILTIYLFLGSVRAMLIPALTVPVSLIGTFIILYALGYTINLLTLLALILAIGIVVDDAIVMLENIHRRIELGESPLKAAFLGARQVGFAIVATTVVLISVFLPIGFLEGDLGKLFREFSVAMSTAVLLSSLVALTLTPMMGSKIMQPVESEPWLVRQVSTVLDCLTRFYRQSLVNWLRRPFLVVGMLVVMLCGSVWLANRIPTEFAPREDRGAMFILINGPQGASYEYMQPYMNEIEHRLMPMVEAGEIMRLLVRAPRGWGQLEDFSNGFAIVVLEDWAQRRNAFVIIRDIQQRLRDLAGVTAFAVMRQPFGRGVNKPVQFVIGGGTYEQLAQWRDILMEQAAQNPGLEGLDHDYKETKPLLGVNINIERAGDLGVSVTEIGQTLESMLGSRVVTRYEWRGEEYDVLIEGQPARQNTPQDLSNLYVRSSHNGELIPLSNLVSVTEYADAPTLNRFNRIRAVTIEANLADNYTLGEALTYLNGLVQQYLPADAVVNYKGPSQDFQTASHSILFVFALALAVVFLVLAAQFESYIHPLVIMLTVPLATFGALLGLYFTGQTLNIYSQIGIIMLVGLAAKNGILIVEFANQLRDQGTAYQDAVIDAACARLRPILMTAITTAAGAVPLILATGAGAETRLVIGIVVLCGITVATCFTLLVIPVVYHLLARHTNSPEFVTRQLEKELAEDNTVLLKKKRLG
ncbi:efflux RND transporter permease subunit [Photobacterium sp. 1_MG-2023]|uniref:efflux RND transporter permease subunit n=1 Tax=Photobacterium sp. 1_MG-2023 TaxID=3062646 RepID=UPI0026E2ED90|nr:efflux RND transporter permease subunit [Photobacterium sp. 1_MG-2023]MDO6708209.1 efflux RND transporter permease subunit [Photobacterium sp. 1_MG-2023]